MKLLTVTAAAALALSTFSAPSRANFIPSPTGTSAAPSETQGWVAKKAPQNAMPHLMLVADGSGQGMMKMDKVIVGDLEITGAFSRETLPNQPAGGGFMTLTNTGTADDVLIAGASPVAARVEIHEMKMDGDVMRMRELAGGLPIPAGETVELKPGGYHIMFMELNQPFVEGEVIDVILTFEKAGDVAVKLKVGPRNASGHMGHMKKKKNNG